MTATLNQHRVPEEEALAGRPLPWTRVLLTLIGGSAAVCAVSFMIPVISDAALDNYDSTLRRYFDTGVEANLPTWWNVSLLTAAAVLSVATAAILRIGSGAGFSRGGGAWVVLALIPFAFSLDDATVVHEHLAKIVDLVSTRQLLPYPWVILGVPIAIAVVIGVAIAAARLPGLPRLLLLSGYGVFFLGALGLEILSAVLVPSDVNLLYVMLYNIEEFLEMAGASLMVVAPLAAFRYTTGPNGVQLSADGGMNGEVLNT